MKRSHWKDVVLAELRATGADLRLIQEYLMDAMHDHPTTDEAIKRAVRQLKKDGYSFTLDEVKDAFNKMRAT